MVDIKPYPYDQLKQIEAIHDILNRYDGEEALERIRKVLYPPLTNDSDDAQKSEAQKGKTQ